MNRKELLEQFKASKPEMGIVAVKNPSGEIIHIEASSNTQGIINRTKFQLGAGMHSNRRLQQEWNASGGEGIILEVVDVLPYDKDESKTDYSDDLEILRLMWVEKLRVRI